MVDALEEDGLVRYWGKASWFFDTYLFANDLFLGVSYGVTLGATLAAMFPDRIDKMVLDGVPNPYDYYHSFL